MAEKNVAKDLLWPKEKEILVRVVFLYVGQGTSTIVMVRDGDTYKVLLVDINLDEERGGIDVPRLMKDLLDGQGLYAFVNSHPHDDHLKGVKELSDAVGITSVWHSGHIPSKHYGSYYDDMNKVIKKVTDEGGKEKEVVLEGSRDSVELGEAMYHVLAPAEYVKDEIKGEKPDVRYARIHEQCAVIKFGIDEAWILLPGDASRPAFEKHITKYHKERLPSVVLGASHHGSLDFFKTSEDEEPYLDALEAIGPDYVVISAPTKKESPHDHPDDKAVKLYADQVKKENVLHTGENRYSFICDIYEDGNIEGPWDDEGKLAESYGLSSDDEGSTEGGFTPRQKPTTVGGGRFAQ